MIVIAGAMMAAVMAPGPSFADTIESVEGARARERQGRWLDRQDREELRRWGSNDDYGRYGYAGRRYDRGSYSGYDHGPVYYYRAYPY
jgi:hypothetical protein